MAQLINAEPDEIYFTGCGTESNNAVLLSLAKMAGENKRIVTSAIEHSAILRVCEELEREGFLVERVGVDSEGRLDLDAWKAAGV